MSEGILTGVGFRGSDDEARSAMTTGVAGHIWQAAVVLVIGLAFFVGRKEMGAITFSTFWYNVAALFYTGALFLSLGVAWRPNILSRRNAVVATALAFLAQTVGMVIRWHEAGLVEIQAVERAQDLVLTGLGRFVVYTQHPPWSNLYEIMVFMAWGIILVYLVSEIRWRIPYVGIFALGLALTALGLASLVDDATVKPLVPALQSWWIMIHVISSVVGYAAGTIAAVMSALYLVRSRDELPIEKLMGYAMGLFALILFILGRGATLFSTFQYKSKVLGQIMGQWIPAAANVQGSFTPWFEPVPGVGVVMAAAVIVSGMGCVMSFAIQKEEHFNFIRIFWVVASILVTLTLGLLVFYISFGSNVELAASHSAQLTAGSPGPWRFHVRALQWDLALFGIVWGGYLFVTLFWLSGDKLIARLPSPKVLDRGAYYSILVAFLLVAVVLVTGALWAHYAWGRYWGWDPKETGALVIWCTYALYLHMRYTYNWSGVPVALVGVLGFFIILAGFLGVNLGWFAGGLHSYGSA